MHNGGHIRSVVEMFIVIWKLFACPVIYVSLFAASVVVRYRILCHTTFMVAKPHLVAHVLRCFEHQALDFFVFAGVKIRQLLPQRVHLWPCVVSLSSCVVGNGVVIV